MQQLLAFWLWLSPACLSASGEGEGPVCSLALLWYSLNPLFCEQSRLQVRAFCWKVLSLSFFFFFFSLAIPHLGLLSHISSLRLSSGYLGPVLTLSTNYAVRSSLSSPHSLVVDASVWATSLLAVLIRRDFIVVVSPSYVAHLLRFPNSPHPTCERVSYCLEISSSRLPPQDGSLSLTLLSLFLSFIFCPTSFQREWAAFLGVWCPLPAFRSFFVEIAQHSDELLINL